MGHVVSTVTDPAVSGVASGDSLIHEQLEQLKDATLLHTDKLDEHGHRIDTILGHLAEISNNLTTATANLAEAGSSIAANAGEAVLEVPAAVAETGDAAVSLVTKDKRRFGPRR